MSDVDTDRQELSPARQREVFRELVSCQDAGMTAEQSRTKLAAWFDVPVATVRDIETIGIAKSWPPLVA